MNSIDEVLNKFIIQTHEGNLKTSHYPKEFLDLKMKVSFGMGVSARVPWISFTAPGMSTSNGYYPVYLYFKDQNRLVLAYGISETSESPIQWRAEIDETKSRIRDVIPGVARYGDSYIHTIYEPDVSEGSVRLIKNGKAATSEELLGDLADISNYYKTSLDIEIRSTGSVVSSGLFYMEQQLEDFIIENWENTELGKRYDLIYEEGVLKSQQFITDIGRIDILATDKTDGNHVVIELKRNQTSDDTVGQVMRYMGWIEEKKQDMNVKGIIISGKYDEKLYYALRAAQNIDVYIYEVNFSLKEHSRVN